MNTIKFTSKTSLKLNGVDYKGYTVGNLPKKFAFIYDESDDKEGITNWFNYKGLNYIEKSSNPWA
jgi:hypothetical protein